MALLESWSIADFKSVGSAHLRLAPLTVIAGANSSGKSSLIQSILVVAQSLGRGGAMVLNGPMVRLGRPKDVVREGQHSLAIGFEFGIDDPGTYAQRKLTRSVSISLAPDPSGETLVPTSIELLDEDGDIVFAATSERLGSADASELARDRRTVSATTFLRVRTLDGRRAPSRTYLGLIGVTPTFLIRHVATAVISKQVRSVLREYARTDGLMYELALELNALVPKRAAATTNRRGLDAGRARPISTSRWTARELGAMEDQEVDALILDAAERRSQREWVSVGPLNFFDSVARLPRRYFADGALENVMASDYDLALLELGSAATALKGLAQNVRYLGPLRDEPRVVHGAWDERVDALPVGIRGELTAELLTRDQSTMVYYRDWHGNNRQDTLPNAVSAWCDYLGIGNQITVLDLGKLGRGVNLRVNGVDRDLTTIGVGASQLLPILVAALSAPNHGVLIFEQPELHLHPSVQSKLADFFLFARPDVRFIVETHSEYLITRIRRRVAEERIAPQSVDVQFAEHDGIATSMRPLDLSVYGNFNDWPVGFFDSQEDDSQLILAAIASRISTGDPH